MARLSNLRSGGFIATYRCTAACGHCIQNSSPQRDARYVSRDEARRALDMVRGLGCGSLHIGGGEPFLDVDGLCMLIGEMRRAGIALDYIETNGFWATSEKRAAQIVQRLRDAGMTVLMLSLCPYHAAYVPLNCVRRALRACEAEGISTFVWQDQFAREVAALGDAEATHSLQEYEAMFPGALDRLPERFGARLLGRAAVTHGGLSAIPTDELLRESRPCAGPLRTGHFHVDLNGDFIPPGCPGIGIRLEDAADISKVNYPTVTCLLEGGVAALVREAERDGFAPRAHYESGCALCQHVRTHLARKGMREDLRPRDFYDDLPL